MRCCPHRHWCVNWIENTDLPFYKCTDMCFWHDLKCPASWDFTLGLVFEKLGWHVVVLWSFVLHECHTWKSGAGSQPGSLDTYIWKTLVTHSLFLNKNCRGLNSLPWGFEPRWWGCTTTPTKIYVVLSWNVHYREQKNKRSCKEI
jgi:hypothetical protein